MPWTSPSDRDPVTKPCPSCGAVGSHGEYGVSCDTDSCRVVFYQEESRRF